MLLITAVLIAAAADCSRAVDWILVPRLQSQHFLPEVGHVAVSEAPIKAAPVLFDIKRADGTGCGALFFSSRWTVGLFV